MVNWYFTSCFTHTRREKEYVELIGAGLINSYVQTVSRGGKL